MSASVTVPATVGDLLTQRRAVDMGRTAVNVAGQALIPTIVAKREGILDLETYDAPRGRTAWREVPVPASA